MLISSMQNALIVFLLCYSQLLHIGQIIPEQPFFYHNAVLPMAHGAHVDGKFLAGWLDKLPVPDGLGLGEGSRHHSYHGGPFS